MQPLLRRETVPLSPLRANHRFHFRSPVDRHRKMLPHKPLRKLILAKAEGNPFFVEEVIRMLIDRGGITRQDSKWVVTREIQNIEKILWDYALSRNFVAHEF